MSKSPRVEERLPTGPGPAIADTGPAAPFSVDVRRLVGDISQTFNPLAGGFALDLRVSPARDGYVCVSVALPEGMTRAFVALLDSLHGLVRVVDNKSRASFAQARAVDLGEIEKTRQFSDSYKAEVCRVFDALTARGVDRREAVKLTNRAMKDAGHPWATFDLVQDTLRAAGRFRSARSGRPRGEPPTGGSNRPR